MTNPLPLDWYSLDRRVSANFVISADGRYKDSNGSSRGISSEVDLQHLIHLRRQCDALVTDGATARLEGYKPNENRTTYVFSRKDVAPGLVRLAAARDLKFAAIFEQLCTDHRAVLLETGPTLLSKALALDLVDTLFLSITQSGGSLKPGLEHAQELLGDLGQLEHSVTIEDTTLVRFAARR